MRARIAESIAQLSRAHRIRHHAVVEGANDTGRHVVVDGKRYLDVASNDYLGLKQHPQLKAAAVRAIEQYGVGAGSAHQILGHYDIHEQLKIALADYVGAEACALFGSGYMANLAIQQAFAKRHQPHYHDRLNHASLIHGARLADVKLCRYRHNDMVDLARLVERHGAGLILTDGVFSMDGDIADIRALDDIAAQSGSLLVIDDAHGFGVVGADGDGRGSLAAHGLSATGHRVQVITFGKAMGGYGAAVVGDRIWIAWLEQAAMPYRYTTALPPHIAASAAAALNVIQEPTRREVLSAHIQKVRHALPVVAPNWPLLPSSTPIQPVVIGDDQRVLEIAAFLREEGVWVAAIRPPTAPTARLRLSLAANHTDADMDTLLTAMTKAYARFGA